MPVSAATPVMVLSLDTLSCPSAGSSFAPWSAVAAWSSEHAIFVVKPEQDPEVNGVEAPDFRWSAIDVDELAKTGYQLRVLQESENGIDLKRSSIPTDNGQKPVPYGVE